MVEQLEFDDFMGISDDSQESQRIHAQIALLKNAIDPADFVLMDYVDKVVPQMLVEYTLQPAKGSTGAKGNTKWAEKDDQSMLAHILNGIFPTLTIVQTAGQALSELEKQLYLIAYSFHDIDKLVGIRDLSVSDAEKSEQFYAYLDEWVSKLHFDQFCPDYEEYRGDIAYLILNTQKRYGVNLNLQSFDLRLPGRRRQYLREMCTASDLIAYLLKNPSGFKEQANVRESLTHLSDGKLEFTYHKVAENRGMITNVINNALLRILRDRLGWKPFLFFPTGVTYLRKRLSQDTILPTLDEIAEDTEKQLIAYCAGSLETNLNGFKREGKGFKFPNYYHQFFSIHDLLKIIIKGCFNKIADEKGTKPGKPLQTLIRKWQTEGKISETIDPENCPASASRLARILELQTQAREDEQTFQRADVVFEIDTRVDQLAEYLNEIEKNVGEVANRETVSTEVVTCLDMRGYQTEFESIPRDNRAGGVPLHWYFLAGKYLVKNRGLDTNQMEDLFTSVANQVAARFKEDIEQHEIEKEGFKVLREYVQQIVDINGYGEIERDFGAELSRYTNTKKKGSGSNEGCSLCSSPFQTNWQEDTAVTFGTQAYTHKNRLGSTNLVRGICELCEVEMMLRQIMIQSKRKLVGGRYDDAKIKWLYFYPTYFFTTETAQFISNAYLQMKRLNLSDVCKELRKGMTVKDFINLDEMVIDSEIPNSNDDDLLKMKFDTNDLATFYFCGIPTRGSKPTDTESWALPTFLGLLMPLVFNAKVVVTESQIPLYHSSEEWRETVVLDAPHAFARHILRQDKLRIDEIEPALRKVAANYDINVDVFQKGRETKWQHLNEIARNIDADPLYVFHYMETFRRKKKSGNFPKPRDGELSVPERYIQIYHHIGGDKMSLIEEVSKRCFKFYSTYNRRTRKHNFTPNSVLKVITRIEDVIINSDPKICSTDLKYQAIGEIGNMMRLIHSGSAQGFPRLPRSEETSAIHDFVEYFYDEVFMKNYNGERALLRQARNRFNAGINAWYQVNWRQFQAKKVEEDNNANN